MDKYTKTLLAVIKIPVGVFCILIGLAFIGVSVWVSTFSDIASMILIISLLGGGCLINYGVGYAFLGDEYKATHLVRNGRTVFSPIESAKFLKRRKLVTLVGVIAYIVLSVYYIARVIFVSIYVANHQNADIDTSPVALIAFAIVSLVFAFCLFMLYKKTKHIDLKEE